MKTTHAAAQFGGAVRWSSLGSVERWIHPELARFYSITVSTSAVVDLVLPAVGVRHLRNGFVLDVVNRGIGGTGNLRFKINDGPRYWDFVARSWVSVANADCLIAPGYFGRARFYGFDISVGADAEEYYPEWTKPTDEPLYFCTRKTATPSEIVS